MDDLGIRERRSRRGTTTTGDGLASLLAAIVALGLAGCLGCAGDTRIFEGGSIGVTLEGDIPWSASPDWTVDFETPGRVDDSGSPGLSCTVELFDGDRAENGSFHLTSISGELEGEMAALDVGFRLAGYDGSAQQEMPQGPTGFWWRSNTAAPEDQLWEAMAAGPDDCLFALGDSFGNGSLSCAGLCLAVPDDDGGWAEQACEMSLVLTWEADHELDDDEVRSRLNEGDG
jgi:hypothetical protein